MFGIIKFKVAPMVNFCLLTGQYIYDVYRTGTQEDMTARMYQSLVSQDFLFFPDTLFP